MKKRFKILALLIVLSIMFVSACNANGSADNSSFVDSGVIEQICAITYDVTPISGSTVNFHTEKQSAFLNGVKQGIVAQAENDYKVSDYAKGKEELSRPLPIVLSWSGDEKTDKYNVELSLSNDFTDRVKYTANGKTLSLYNLYSGTRYYWRVAPFEEDITRSSVYSFTTENGVRNVFVDGISNVRDLGGYTTDYGVKVRQGLIYRGGRWNTTWSKTLEMNFQGEGLDTVIKDLAIKTELDLRGEGDDERGQMNNSAIPEINYLYYGCSWSKGLYEANKETVRRIFEEVLADRKKYPIYFHCNIGTDRTGMIAYLLNGMLGVSEKDLQVDYLLSNFGNIGGSRSLSGDMNEYVSLIKAEKGSSYRNKIETFLVNDVGVSLQTIDKIRNILLEK